MRHLLSLIILGLALQANTAFADLNSENLNSPKPSAELTPNEVVVIVVDALKNNDATKNNGIATVFDFASPANRSFTGPLERFTKMIKSGFSDMLNHFSSTFGEIEISEGVALQPVWLTSSTGEEQGYVFKLGMQEGGEFDGMWMTESVWPISASNPLGQSI